MECANIVCLEQGFTVQLNCVPFVDFEAKNEAPPLIAGLARRPTGPAGLHSRGNDALTACKRRSGRQWYTGAAHGV